MDRPTIERYYSVIVVLREMEKRGIISLEEFNKSEALLCKKLCIKDNDIYRTNDLIKSDFRGIYIVRKETENNE